MKGIVSCTYTYNDKYISLSFCYRPASDYECYYTKTNKPDFYLDCHDEAIKTIPLTGDEFMGGAAGDSSVTFRESNSQAYTTQDKTVTIPHFQHDYTYYCNSSTKVVYLGSIETTKFTAHFYAYKDAFYYKKHMK